MMLSRSLRARIDDLEPDEQQTLRDWYNNGVRDTDEGHHKIGLWINGDRRHGSSYIAECAVGFLESRGWEWERVPARSMIHIIREYWRLGEISRKHTDDYSLHLEYLDIEAVRERYLFQVPVLWVDDLHGDTIDLRIWKRNVQPYLEDRCKERLPTVVATDLRVDDGRLVEQAIEDLFVVCPALKLVSSRGTR